MPFLAAAAPFITAGAGALGASATTAGLIGAGAATIGGLAASNQAKSQAGQAAQAAQVDIDKLNSQVQAIAKQNAALSAQLEAEMTPEVPQLRTASNQAILAGIGPNATEDATMKALMARLGTDAIPEVSATQIRPGLLSEAIVASRQQLAQGSQLPQDVRNAVARAAMAKSGTVASGAGVGLGRDIVARDLGLTSLDLLNQRLNNAAQIGSLESGVQQFNAGQLNNVALANAANKGANASNFLNQIQMLNQITGNQYNRALAAGQYGNSIAMPNVGLDPTAVANIVSGNATNASKALSNQANISGAQGNNYLTLAGQLAGYGFGTKAANPYSIDTSVGSGYSPAPYSFTGK